MNKVRGGKKKGIRRGEDEMWEKKSCGERREET